MGPDPAVRAAARATRTSRITRAAASAGPQRSGGAALARLSAVRSGTKRGDRRPDEVRACRGSARCGAKCTQTCRNPAAARCAGRSNVR